MQDRKAQRLSTSDLAGIQYAGLTGITGACISAIARNLTGDEVISNAALLSCSSNHAFLLYTEYGQIIAIKSGFTSGYSGEGPRGLAVALMLLDRHHVSVEEYKVDRAFFDRLECSSLLQQDIESIETAQAIRPSQCYDYIHAQGYKLHSNKNGLSQYYPQLMPFSIIDERIVDLAVKFRGNEDSVIISAFRRLEDLLRKRTGLTGEGSKLFSKIFLSDDAPLKWDVPDDGESKGRANLFSATYMAFRNARVHREMESGAESLLREFLLINELYRLEAEAMTEAEMEVRKKKQEELDKTLAALEAEQQDEIG